MARRLSGLDAAWLRRCQGEAGPVETPRGGAELGGVEFNGVGGENVAPRRVCAPQRGLEVSEGARGEVVEAEGGDKGAGGNGDNTVGWGGADGGPKKLPTNRVGGKRGRGDSGVGGGEEPARKKAPAPAENLLGEVEEEEEEEKKLRPSRRAAPSRWVPRWVFGVFLG